MTGVPFPPGADEDTPIFVISVAAQLSGLHAQTLRGYDRMGLVSPGRATGRCASSFWPVTPSAAESATPTMSEARSMTWISS